MKYLVRAQYKQIVILRNSACGVLDVVYVNIEYVCQFDAVCILWSISCASSCLKTIGGFKEVYCKVAYFVNMCAHNSRTFVGVCTV